MCYSVCSKLRGWALFVGDAGSDVSCGAPYAGGRGGEQLCLLEMLEVIRSVYWRLWTVGSVCWRCLRCGRC